MQAQKAPSILPPEYSTQLDHTLSDSIVRSDPNALDRGCVMKKIAATINETTEITGLSRCAIYRLIREGKLIKRRVNGRTFLLIADLEKFFNDLPAESAAKQ